MGFLYYVIASSDRLDEALQRCARYSSVANEGIRLTLRKTKQHIGVVFEYEGVARRLERHQIEFLVGSVIRVCRQITNRHLTADHVSFSHWRRASPELSRFFGCDIKFGANVDEVMFPSSIQDIAVISCDPYLNRLLIQYYEEALAHRKARQSSFAVNVENTIVLLMPHGKAQAARSRAEVGYGPTNPCPTPFIGGTDIRRCVAKSPMRSCQASPCRRRFIHFQDCLVAWLPGRQCIHQCVQALDRKGTLCNSQRLQ